MNKDLLNSSLLKDISGILFSTPFNVVVTVEHGIRPSLYFRTNSQIDTSCFELVFDIESKVLYVRFTDKTLLSFDPINDCIYFTIPSLENISNAGDGSLLGSVYCDVLHLDNKGSGNIDFDIKTKKLLVDNKSSGKINLKGKTKDLTIDNRGNGDINILEIVAENIKVNSFSNGNTYTNCTNTIQGKLRGAGSIYVAGNPATTISSYGTGNVYKLTEAQVSRMNSIKKSQYTVNNTNKNINDDDITHNDLLYDDYLYEKNYHPDEDKYPNEKHDDSYDDEDEDEDDEEYENLLLIENVNKKGQEIKSNSISIKEKLRAKIKSML